MSSGTAKSSGMSQGSSSGGCSFYIHDLLVGVSDDQMIFSITNDGTTVLEITAILSALPGVTLAPDTPLPIFLLSGGSITITVNSDPASTDLRGTTFTVQTDCGDQSDIFPVA
jgi:archaellum component FlaF (FlaF/FlaG flagellin family)